MQNIRSKLPVLKSSSVGILCRRWKSKKGKKDDCAKASTEKYKIGKSAVVTGCAMGIGLEFVKSLLEAGVMNILMSDVMGAVKQGEDELNKFRRKYKNSCMCFVKCDVTNDKDMKALFATGKELYGNIDIVINNAGIFNEAVWDKMVDINLKGVIRGTQLGMKYMAGRGGTIVNVASILGLQPLAGAPVYVATKHSVIGLTRSWAMPYHYERSRVRVMAICPGVTLTPLISKAHKESAGNPLAQEASRELAALPDQHVCYTGQCLIQMLKEGDTGSIWITEGKDNYEVAIPDRQSLHRRC